MIVLDSIPFSAQPPMNHEKSAEEIGSLPEFLRRPVSRKFALQTETAWAAVYGKITAGKPSLLVRKPNARLLYL
jgi:hypothetical protein